MQHSLQNHETNGIVVHDKHPHPGGELIRGVQFRKICVSSRRITRAVGCAATRSITVIHKRERLLLEARHGWPYVPHRHLSTSSATTYYYVPATHGAHNNNPTKCPSASPPPPPITSSRSNPHPREPPHSEHLTQKLKAHTTKKTSQEKLLLLPLPPPIPP